MNLLKLCSIFTAMIIAFLPICHAANSIEWESRTGIDRIEGYAKATDSLKYSVLVEIENDDSLTPNQVKLMGTYPFSSCSPSLTQYKCELLGYPIENTLAKTWPISVTLYDDDNNVLDTAATDITIDDDAPTVEFTAVPVQHAGQMTVSFRAVDTACAGCGANYCSGIGRIVLRDGPNTLKDFSPNATGCLYEGTETVNAPASTGAITIDVYDKFGLRGTATTSRSELDLSAPEIITDSFKMYLNDTLLGTGIKLGSFNARFTIEIKEENPLNLANVRLDASSLGGNPWLAAIRCTKTGDINECSWDNVGIKIEQAGTYDIQISVEDIVGNSDNKTISKTFAIDDTAPLVTFLGTAYVYNENSYIGKPGANIIARITETGSGLYQKKMFLDLSELNLGYRSFKQADSCLEISSGTWECVWQNITTNLNQGTKKIYLNSALSADGVGNAVTGTLSATVIIDKTNPVVNKVMAVGIYDVGNPGLYLVSGGNVMIAANISETSGISATVDFTKVINNPDYKNVAGECEKDGDYWICGWLNGIIKDGYDRNATMNVVFYDIAHNNITTVLGLPIYPRDTSTTTPDYWSIASMEIMPKGIDRSTASIFKHRAYVSIALEPSSDEIMMMDVGKSTCTGDVSYLDSEERIMNNQIGTKNPILMFEFREADLTKINDLNFSCTLQLISLDTRQRTVSQIEYETINISIPTYNVPMGEVSGDVRKSIDDIYNKYVDSGLYKTVGSLAKFMNLAENLCKLIAMWRQIQQLFLTIELMFHGIPADRMVGKRCWQTEAKQKAGDTAHKGLQRFCDFLTCKQGTLAPKKFVDSLMNMCGAKLVARWQGTGKTAAPPGGVEAMKQFQSPGSYMNVKENFILSALTVCIPGIIYNLQKYRQIKCMEGLCMMNSAYTGASVGACKEISGYMKCKYIWGAIFQLCPLLQFYDYVVNMIKSAFLNPVSLMGIVWAKVCSMHCRGGRTTIPTHFACAAPKILSQLGESLSNLEYIAKMKKEDFGLKGDYCDKFKSMYGEIKTSTTTSST